MITVVCYGQKRVWQNRTSALNHYVEAMMGCDPNSSEASRYMNIYVGLLAGMDYVTDGE